VEASIGYDVSREEALGSRVGGGLRAMHNAAVFGSFEWHPHPEWTLRPGLRVLYNSVFRAPLVPSLHAKWARGPHAVRASYARGFRAPELKELYFEFVDFNHNLRGNTDLRSEVSNSFQASYTLRRLTDRAFLSPTLKFFHTEVTDLIDLALVDPETTSYMYVNVGRVRTTGMSAGFDRTGDVLTLRTQVTAVERSVAIDPASDAPERNRSVQLAAGCDVRLPREVVLTFQTNYAHNETLLAPDGNGGWAQATLSPLTLLSLYVARTWAGGRVTSTAGVDNLLNTTFRTLSGETVGTGGLHSAATGSQPVSLGRNFRFTLFIPFS
jgi:outer membrane receptor for ferrienterochelin and colicins